jgi:hypothetical protein
MLELKRCKRTDPQYQEIRDRHYVLNRGCCGQQLHYLVLKDEKVIGIISGASAVFAVKARDDFFGLNKENKKVALNSIINNVVFRLELNEKNLGTQILSMWRKQIAIDWEERYKVKVHGFETFVVEEDYRKGSMYKADNWTYLGETQGSTKSHKGLENPWVRKSTGKKLIFAIKIKNTKLCTEYHATWNLKSKKSSEINDNISVEE